MPEPSRESTDTPRVRDQLHEAIERELTKGIRADGRRDLGDGVVMFSELAPPQPPQ